MILEVIATENGGISLVWFAATAFSIAMILLGVVWRSQIAQQKEGLEEQKLLRRAVEHLAMDIEVMKNNSSNMNSNVSAMRKDMDDIKDDFNGLDRRVYKLEVAK